MHENGQNLVKNCPTSISVFIFFFPFLFHLILWAKCLTSHKAIECKCKIGIEKRFAFDIYWLLAYPQMGDLHHVLNADEDDDDYESDTLKQ